MILSKTYCSLIFVLVYKIKMFGGTLSEVDRKCSESIKDHFLVETDNQKAKAYCVHALYNFRLTETLENSSFKDLNGKHNAYAEEYYKWLVKYVEIGLKMKTPEVFCRTIFGRKKGITFRSACIEELRSIIGNLNQSKEKIFQWMYYNITLDKIQTSEVLQGYIKHVSAHLILDIDRICSDAIKDFYLVEIEHPRAKAYCLHALYNFRLSKTPEKSTFIDIFAEEYYKWLINFVEIGPMMKTPKEYCTILHGRKRSSKFRSACIEELSSILGNLNQSKEELFHWMYNNLTLDKIQASEMLQGFMKHVSAHVYVDNAKHCPPKFCKDYYTLKKELPKTA